MERFSRSNKRRKRFVTIIAIAIVIVIGAFNLDAAHQQNAADDSTANLPTSTSSPAAQALQALPIKGRAPKTGYERTQFGAGWNKVNGCDTRNLILQRDLKDVVFVGSMDVVGCLVASGTLNDPYTGKTVQFVRGPQTSDDVQIDHVVALSDAWQKGAQQLPFDTRNQFANDPLNLLAVEGAANQNKGDGDAATWLPSNKAFRCDYVARQIAVKTKYRLWVTRSEYDAINKVLDGCPQQTLPV